ncbi:MAG: hypothetical protein HPY57_12625 [Ignavibacteria bacterium]|nr:hypothetical protein [Ignavibacteria bacterium]
MDFLRLKIDTLKRKRALERLNDMYKKGYRDALNDLEEELKYLEQDILNISILRYRLFEIDGDLYRFGETIDDKRILVIKLGEPMVYKIVEI